MARRGGKSAIEVVEEIGPDARRDGDDNACPACGAPNGRVNCQKCGWGAEDLEPRFGENILDPVTTIRDARLSFIRMKDEIKALKGMNDLLIQNNHKFGELVEAMGGLIGRLRVEAGKKYVYSYLDGGWGEAGQDGKMMLHLKKDVTVQEINRQLAEIIGLIGKYRK